MDSIDRYIEKWSAIIPQAELIQHDAAVDSIKQIYHFLNLSEPPIFFASQPDRALGIFLKSKF